jgi:hypothetical protein
MANMEVGSHAHQRSDRYNRYNPRETGENPRNLAYRTGDMAGQNKT